MKTSGRITLFLIVLAMIVAPQVIGANMSTGEKAEVVLDREIGSNPNVDAAEAQRAALESRFPEGVLREMVKSGILHDGVFARSDNRPSHPKGASVAISGFPRLMFNSELTLSDVSTESPGVEVISGDWCVGADGALLWKSPGAKILAVADIDKNGTLNPITYVPGLGPGELLALDGDDGNSIATLAETFTPPLKVIAVDLVTDDNSLEVICQEPTKLRAFSGGVELWEYDFSPSIVVGMAVGDLDINGDSDILVSTMNIVSGAVEITRLIVPNAPGATPSADWTKTFLSHVTISTPILVPTETVGATGLDVVVAGVNATDLVLWRHAADGALLTTTLLPIQGSYGRTISAGDVDGDGKAEIIVNNGSYLATVDGDGSTINTLSVATLSQHAFPSVDVDNDGDAEIITIRKQDSPAALVLEVRDGYLLSVIESVSVSSSISASHLHAPVVGDLDQDGDAEIAFQDTDSLHVYDVGGAAGRYDWPQEGKYASRTSVYEQPLTGVVLSNSALNDMSLAGDVRVSETAVTAELFVSAGTTIRMEQNAQLVSAEDMLMMGGSGAHITVERAGALHWNQIIAGSLGNQSILHYVDITGGWTMFRAHHTALIAGCTLDNGYEAIKTNAWVSVYSTTISNMYVSGVILDNGTSDAWVTNTTFDNVPVAIRNNSDGVTITADISGMYDVGIELAKDATIVNSSFSTSSGLGIHVPLGVAATITNSTIDGQALGGIECDDCDPATVIEDVNLSNNAAFGISIVDTDQILIKSCELTGNNSDAIVLSNASPTITECLFEDNSGDGVSCDSGSDPVIEKSGFFDNGDGVSAIGDSYPNVGNGTYGGYNHFQAPNSVRNDNLNQSIPVFAQYNWWGTPKCPKLWIGNVTCAPALTSSPPIYWSASGEVVAGADNSVPESFALGNPYPNPFNPRASVPINVPRDGGLVTLRIYNVKGQLVRELVNESMTPGFHTLIWNGISDQGQSVSSGIYFVKMVAAGYVETRKMVMLK